MKTLIFAISLILVSNFICSTITAQVLDHSWKNIVRNSSNKWYGSQEAINIAENVLLYQRDIGGWPKNTQMQRELTESEKERLAQLKANPKGCTTDNGATIIEMGFLSKLYAQVPDAKYKAAFLLALDYLLEAQYESGGWPQFYPLKKGYFTHITYNDNSMANIMNLLHHLSKNDKTYSIEPSEEKINQIKIAFNKGIVCILKTQYQQNGKLTGWCAQHDEFTFEPAKARAYELPSLSGQESAGVVLLLMSVENPSEEIKTAITSAVEWFEKTKITGLRIKRYKTENGLREKRIVNDPTAPPVWARFMELENNTPFFCDRDGIKKYSLMDIGQERRVGYRWYSQNPKQVLKEFPKWNKKWSVKK